MHWRQFYRVRHSLRSSLWTVPIIAIPFAMFATRLAHWLDARIQWSFLGFGVKGAEALLQATATATLSFLVFTFGSLLVALQVASGQLTPRIIATTLLRNNVVRYTVGLFIFTFLFTLGVQNRLESKVYQLPLIIAAVLALLCFAAFLYLIDYAARLLRPLGDLSARTLLCGTGRRVFLLRRLLFACLDPLGEILFYDTGDFSHHHRVQPR
jgi:uncharacterized membrane protein